MAGKIATKQYFEFHTYEEAYKRHINVCCKICSSTENFKMPKGLIHSDLYDEV